MSRSVLRREVDDIGKRNINKSSYRNRQLAGKTTTIDEYTKEKIYLNTRKLTKVLSTIIKIIRL